MSSTAAKPKTLVFYEDPVLVDFVTGDSTGLAIPAHGEALRAAGVDFLTTAFRAYGVLAKDNAVARITRFDVCPDGSTGEKFIMDLQYTHDQPGLPTEVFVKFSRDFKDAFRDRRRGELESEINLLSLSRHPEFPVAVPRPCFGDFNHESGTGMLIMERIGFGQGNIQPALPKCMDHKLENPLEYYQAVVTAQARLAAAHKSGVLSPAVEKLFPYDPQSEIESDTIPYNDEQLRQLVQRYADFVQTCPQLLPPRIKTPEFIATLGRDIHRIKRHEKTIKQYLYANPDYVALTHFNTHIDNAWFWRDASGVLQCGLLDWQRARPMNLGAALWGGLCGANPDLWEHHLDGLVALFIDELRAHGGPALDHDELMLHIALYAAVMGTFVLLDAPSVVLFRVPEVVNASSTQDDVLLRNESARSFLNACTAYLNLWAMHDYGTGLDKVLARIGRPDLKGS